MHLKGSFCVETIKIVANNILIATKFALRQGPELRFESQ